MTEVRLRLEFREAATGKVVSTAPSVHQIEADKPISNVGNDHVEINGVVYGVYFYFDPPLVVQGEDS